MVLYLSVKCQDHLLRFVIFDDKEGKRSMLCCQNPLALLFKSLKAVTDTVDQSLCDHTGGLELL